MLCPVAISSTYSAPSGLSATAVAERGAPGGVAAPAGGHETDHALERDVDHAALAREVGETERRQAGDHALEPAPRQDALQEGRWQEAVELQRRAVAAAPLSQSTRYNLAWMLFVTGQLEEAESELMAISELSPRAGSADLLGFVRIRSGRPAEALDTCTADTPDGLQCRAMAHYALGDRAEAEAAMRELIETRGQQDPLRVAETYAYFGETEAAFQWLQKGGAGFAATPWGTPSHVIRPFAMRVSPFSASLNKDRRWSEWLESQQQPQAAQTSKRG